MASPYHLSSLPKPQKLYNMKIDNTNTPFLHQLLPRTPDSEPVHPAILYNPIDFAFVPSIQPCPCQPLPIESTPFTLVETSSDLHRLATKLSEVDEFAVDLEHNSYRSYQGITCLMQISTRTEDFVVDTFKLWDQIGDSLRHVFQDPNKRKIMHGAINDMSWLQRDFEIYVCNLFDTMQASKVLKLERNSLEHLLKHYCGVVANKEYQASDWRIRPLPDNMVKYAREDTHFLLYIHDLMRKELISLSDDRLIEAYQKSYEISVHLYKKEVLGSASYVYVYGLREANLDTKQLLAVSALFGWRDTIARKEDESTGYVLPNKVLLEIAKKLPKNREELLEIVGYNRPCVLAHIESLVGILQQHLNRPDAFVGEFAIAGRQLQQQEMTLSEIADSILRRCYLMQCQQVERLKMNSYLIPRCQPRMMNQVFVPVLPQYVRYYPSYMYRA